LTKEIYHVTLFINEIRSPTKSLFPSRKEGYFSASVSAAGIIDPWRKTYRCARVEAGYAVAEEAMLSHRQTVLRALTEVEDSLVAVMPDRQERESMRDITSARDLSLKATLAQSDAGIADEVRLLEAKKLYLNARISSAISENNYRQSLLSLNLALGAPVNEKK
jgi:outer membrane protein TolC